MIREESDEKGIWRTEEEIEGGKGRIETLYQRTRKFGRGSEWKKEKVKRSGNGAKGERNEMKNEMRERE